ncbi:MAG: hypothetical protein ACQCXQ_12320, partial [Verrucomicrobiales bacterium]
APTGPSSNGGAVGVFCLIVAGVLAWSAFLATRHHSLRRYCVYLPFACLVTYIAGHDAGAQYVTGWWF